MSPAKPTLDHHPVVFLSYARNAPDVRRWVRRVLDPALREALPHAGLVHPNALFRDEHDLSEGDDWPEALAFALRQCSVLVPVFTPAYFHRPWCTTELATMAARAKRLDRPTIVPILWRTNAHFVPEPYDRIQAFSFDRWTHLTRHTGHKGLRDRVYALCDRLYDLAQRPVDDPGWQVVSPPAPVSAPRPSALPTLSRRSHD